MARDLLCPRGGAMPHAPTTSRLFLFAAALGALALGCAAQPADRAATAARRGPLFATSESDPFRLELGITPMFSGSTLPYDGEGVVIDNARIGMTHDDRGLTLRFSGDLLDAPGGGPRVVGPLRAGSDGTFHYVGNQRFDVVWDAVCEDYRGPRDARVSIVVRLLDASGRVTPTLREEVARIDVEMDALFEELKVNALGCIALSPKVDIRLQSERTSVAVRTEGEPEPEPEATPEPAPDSGTPSAEPDPAPPEETPETTPADPDPEEPEGGEATDPTPAPDASDPETRAPGTGEGGEPCPVVAPETWRCVASLSLGTTVSQVCRDAVWRDYQIEPLDCRGCAGRYSDACDGTAVESGPSHLPLAEPGAGCSDAPTEMWRCAFSPSWEATVSQVCRDGRWLSFHLRPRDCMGCWGSFSDACRQ